MPGPSRHFHSSNRPVCRNHGALNRSALIIEASHENAAAQGYESLGLGGLKVPVRSGVAVRLDAVEHPVEVLPVLVEAYNTALPGITLRSLRYAIKQFLAERYERERIGVAS